MPKRTDLRSILIIGSGPIRIGQACEFDYSGAQACRVLRAHGYRVVLVNSNPATIMTDPEWADATYLEPLDAEAVAEVIERERPEALLPTLGGQTALNLAVELSAAGVLDRLGVELIGADLSAIFRAEDRRQFREAMKEAGLRVPESLVLHSVDQLSPGMAPAVVRPAFTLGGTGGGLARTEEELRRQVEIGLRRSPISEVLVERSVEGWQEFELEVMSDLAGSCVVVCSIENIEPMGVHTGDSWTVAPQQTLPDGEYQRLREAAFACARTVGVATGGANVQFAYEPKTRELVLIEMNPRVSRSSALASKATGFPIAKLAALLAVGYTLEELPNDITQKTTAAFEPALDYIAVKAPRFDFEKFPGAEPRLGTEMRAVGEALGLGRTFPEAFLKALEGLETGTGGQVLKLSTRGNGNECANSSPDPGGRETGGRILQSRETGGRETVGRILQSSTRGYGNECLNARYDPARDDPAKELPDFPGAHPYFLAELEEIRAAERRLAEDGDVAAAKRYGLPDSRIARILRVPEEEVRRRRPLPGRLAVDSCAAEFEARTPYYYLSYEPSDSGGNGAGAPAILILGSGPNRIGQGIEFDYCCVHAAQAFRALGYEAVMLNSNPETVSTDYDTSHRLYLEPVTLERALDVCALEQPLGVVVTLGGQTPLRLARDLADAGVPLLGDPLPAIEAAEDRGRFGEVLAELGLRAPAWGVADTEEEARAVAARIGYPVLVRPHYVLGGRGMRIAYGPEEISLLGPSLVDEFIDRALELDVDALCDGESAWVAGVLEHVEPAGVHSGDSACVIPAPSVGAALAGEIRELASALSARLGARGLLNLQLAVRSGEVYVLEANPRASRTVPFVAKATGIPLVEHACRLMLGEPLEALGLPERAEATRAWAKEAIFPVDRFPGADDRGPEMRSTGEVMAGGETPADAYRRVLRAAGRSRAPGAIGPSLQELGRRSAAALALG